MYYTDTVDPLGVPHKPLINVLNPWTPTKEILSSKENHRSTERTRSKRESRCDKFTYQPSSTTAQHRSWAKCCTSISCSCNKSSSRLTKEQEKVLQKGNINNTRLKKSQRINPEYQINHWQQDINLNERNKNCSHHHKDLSSINIGNTPLQWVRKSYPAFR